MVGGTGIISHTQTPSVLCCPVEHPAEGSSSGIGMGIGDGLE